MSMSATKCADPSNLNSIPKQALIAAQKQILDLTKNGWVAFREYDGKLLLYFTSLI